MAVLFLSGPLLDSPLSSWLPLKRDTLFVPFFSAFAVWVSAPSENAVISRLSKEAVKYVEILRGKNLKCA